MPIPSPKPNEAQDKFIGRCMSWMHDNESDRPRDQQLAMCFSSFRQAHKKKTEKAFIPSTPFLISEAKVVEAEGIKKVVIKGDLMDDSVNKNYWRVRAEELKNIAASFMGIPIKVQHSISDWEIIGTGAKADVMGNHVPYAADITDRHAISKFEDGTWNKENMGVSPKLGYESLICSVCGGNAEECEHIRGKIYNGSHAYIDVIGAHLKEVSLTSEAAFKPSAGSIDDITLFASIDKIKLNGGLSMKGEEEENETPPTEGEGEDEDTGEEEVEEKLKETEAKLKKKEEELKATNERLSKFVEAKRTEELKKRISDEKLVAQILEENKKVSDEEFKAQLKKIDAIQAGVVKKPPEEPPEVVGQDNTQKGSVPPEDNEPDLKAREEQIGVQLFGSHYKTLIGMKEAN